MTFSSSQTARTVFGNKVIMYGTYTNAATDTGGDIDTGLNVCEHIVLTSNSANFAVSASVVNETLPASGNAITILSSLGNDGYWMAFGY